MAKPLRSDNPTPQNIQFAHFGILDDGKQSKGAFTTAIVTNLLIAALIIIVGSAVKKVVSVNEKKEIAFVQPVKEPPPPPPPPPPRLVPPPPPKVLEPPKIKVPEPEKLPEIKPIEVKMAPQPVHMAPAPPKAVTPPPAPKAVSLAANIAPAAVKNNDAHPSAVRLGTPDNPLKPLTGPAVAKVDFGVAGHPGMPASNTGSGPHSATTVSGFGCPTCTDLNGKDRGSRQIAGVKIGGVPNGTGPLNSKGTSPVAVNIGRLQEPTPAPTQAARVSSAAAPPKLISKPQPVYTDEAKQLHLEGAVSIRIRVSSLGAVSVLGVAHGLGHGLDQSAVHAAQGMRFSPALDPSGHPVDWEGTVNVNFQMAG